MTLDASPSAISRNARATLLALVACCATTMASAQAWPTKPVTLVVGTPAGGSVDAYGRALADQLARQTGGTFLVENKRGANGNLSAEQVKNAQADGHTLWISTQAMFTINPSVYSAMRWKQADFKPIAKGIESPLVLVTHPSVPAKTLSELVKWVSANPGKVNYASFSPGTPSHFLGFQLNERFKLDMVHVAYKGSAPQIADLLGGQVLVGFTQLQAALPNVQSGKLNAIAVTSRVRTNFMPQVPSLAELGFPELSSTVWFGLVAPSATPRTVLDQILAATVKAQADAAYKARLEAQGFDVPQESGDEFAATIAAETARWAQVVKATGFRANE
ncbi:MAG: Bug family tripartite tricarboxylate transporter substrate binding protein [Hydrogenophaga sp.]|uniref:Bug family tripartite tricarboxylate transporter substrate binding protein n=1 Tax=Hydrogenophaga sp. TaxID=1904254 RepID=UPI003D10B308